MALYNKLPELITKFTTNESGLRPIVCKRARAATSLKKMSLHFFSFEFYETFERSLFIKAY